MYIIFYSFVNSLFWFSLCVRWLNDSISQKKFNFFSLRVHRNGLEFETTLSEIQVRAKKETKNVDRIKVKFSSGDKLVSNENWNKTAQHAIILFIIILCSPTHLDADRSFAVAKWLFYQSQRACAGDTILMISAFTSNLYYALILCG